MVHDLGFLESWIWMLIVFLIDRESLPFATLFKGLFFFFFFFCLGTS